MYEFSMKSKNVLKEKITLVQKKINQVVKGVDNKEEDGSFVVLSDFHGYEHALDKVKSYYLDEYDCIYILGDATDRGPTRDGEGSIKLLCDIKKLTEQYPGRVVYVPGNHDEFLVGAVRGGNYDYRELIEWNGGKQALEEFDLLKRENPGEFCQLVSWLENLPIQRTHVYEGQEYVLAHAFFNQRLYDANPNYSLKDYFDMPNSALSEDLRQVLWFRKSKDKYNAADCPSSKSIMVIGHTPVSRMKESYDLVDRKGRTVKVHCVDGGIAYKGSMLKYDGGKEPIKTLFFKHQNTSPGRKKEDLGAKLTRNDDVDSRDVLNSYIIEQVHEKGRDAFHLLCDDTPNDVITDQECANVIMSYEGKNGFIYSKSSDDPLFLFDAYSMYKKVVVFDFIVEKLMAKYDDLSLVDNYLDAYIFGYEDDLPGELAYITREGDARTFAEALGVENMRQVLCAHNCSNVSEYIDGSSDKKKIYCKKQDDE